MPQKTIFKDILLVLAILCLLFVAYTTYSMNNKVNNYIEKEAETVEVIGMGNELSAVVDSLEQALLERSKLKFYARTDPLDLTKIIVNIPAEVLAIQEKEMKEKEKKSLIRKSELKLNATLISSEGNSAIFYYNGKNIRVKEGESVDNKKIKSITDGSVVVVENGVKKVYTTK